jgi:hypothetical protein
VYPTDLAWRGESRIMVLHNVGRTRKSMDHTRDFEREGSRGTCSVACQKEGIKADVSQCLYVAVHLSCLTGPLLGSDESTPPAPLWCLILLCWPPRCERRSLHLPPVHIWTSKRGMVIVTHPVLHTSSPFVMTTSSDDSVGISPAKPLAG